MDEKTKSLIDGTYLTVCSPEMAYKWLRDRVAPMSVYRSAPFIPSGGIHEYFETILFQRNDSLIDCGLARHGWSGAIASKLYPRLDLGGRCAMRAYHLAAGGPPEPFLSEITNLTGDIETEFTAWIYNPNHSDDFFEALFNKSGLFEGLSVDQYQNAIQSAGRNTRLSTPYKSLYLDGFDEYLYNKVLVDAWNMTLSVPTNQEWAGTLVELLQNVVRIQGFDVRAAIERWQIDERDSTIDNLFENPPSFFLRSTIADNITPDNELIGSRDVSLRFSFYRRFDPHQFSNWPTFINNDKQMCFEGVLENTNIWRDRQERERLAQIAWSMPDPNHRMDAVNEFRARESHLKTEFPRWFKESTE